MVKQVSRILLHSLVFFTPFIFVQNTNELFEFPKMYFVYLVGSLLIVVTALGRLWGTGCSNRPFSKILGLFAISFILSTILSTHPYTSIWGYFSRFNGGLVSVLIFFGIYLATTFLQPSAKDLLRTTSFTMLPISVYAILQHFGLGGGWVSDTTVRAFSTFGQPNWYAAYCAAVLPVILYFGLGEKHRIVNKMGWFFLFTLGFSGFWFSYSVSGIVGLAASITFVVLLNLKSTKENLLPLLITVLICSTIAFLNPGIFKQKLDDALKDVFPSTPSAVLTPTPLDEPQPSEGGTYNITDSGFIRKEIWKGTLDLWLSSPKNFLIGTGPETFPYEFQKFRPASLNYSSEWNYILNKPHNYYLELPSQNGIVGLLIYLTIIVKVLLTKHPALTPALFGLFITNIFGWPTVSTALLFWVFLALLNIDRDGGEGRVPQNALLKVFRAPSPPRLVTSIILIAAYTTLNIQFTKQYLADIASKASDRYFEQGNTQKAIAFSNQSINLNPHEPFYYRQRAKTRMLETVGKNTDEVSHIKAAAQKDILKAYELNPKNLATLRGNAPLYYFLTLKDISAAAQQNPQGSKLDPFYLELSKNYYQKLSQTYPNDVGVLALVAKYQKMLGLAADYENTVGQIKPLRPDLLDWYLK